MCLHAVLRVGSREWFLRSNALSSLGDLEPRQASGRGGDTGTDDGVRRPRIDVTVDTAVPSGRTPNGVTERAALFAYEDAAVVLAPSVDAIPHRTPNGVSERAALQTYEDAAVVLAPLMETIGRTPNGVTERSAQHQAGSAGRPTADDIDTGESPNKNEYGHDKGDLKSVRVDTESVGHFHSQNSDGRRLTALEAGWLKVPRVPTPLLDVRTIGATTARLRRISFTRIAVGGILLIGVCTTVCNMMPRLRSDGDGPGGAHFSHRVPPSWNPEINTLTASGHIVRMFRCG